MIIIECAKKQERKLISNTNKWGFLGEKVTKISEACSAENSC